MKLKKILSAVLAGTMAVTAMASMSMFGASAADSKVLFTGEKEFSSDWNGNITVGASELQYWSDASVKVEYTLTEGASYSQLQLKYVDADYAWLDLSEVVDVTGTSYTFDLSAEDLELVTAGNQFIVGGCSLTVTKVTITGTYDAPELDAWCDNGDGTFSYSSSVQGGPENGTLSINLANYTDANFADITSITVEMETTGFANGCIGLNDTSGTWTQKGHEGSTVTLDVDGVEAGQSLQIQLWWVNAGSNITIKDVIVEAASSELQPNVKYAQKTDVVDGKYSERFVMMISEEDAIAAKKVTFTLGNGSATVNKTSKNYYTSISVAGDTLTAPEGYVFVAYAVKNIPESITLTCDIALA